MKDGIVFINITKQQLAKRVKPYTMKNDVLIEAMLVNHKSAKGDEGIT
jgi:hypothetical protein